MSVEAPRQQGPWEWKPQGNRAQGPRVWKPQGNRAQECGSPKATGPKSVEAPRQQGPREWKPQGNRAQESGSPKATGPKRVEALRQQGPREWKPLGSNFIKVSKIILLNFRIRKRREKHYTTISRLSYPAVLNTQKINKCHIL